MVSIECVATTWPIAVLRWGAPTSRVSFQRTHQPGAFRQAIALFFRHGACGLDRTGEPIRPFAGPNSLASGIGRFAERGLVFVRSST